MAMILSVRRVKSNKKVVDWAKLQEKRNKYPSTALTVERQVTSQQTISTRKDTQSVFSTICLATNHLSVAHPEQGRMKIYG